MLKLPRDLSVRPSRQFADDLDAILGGGTVQLFGAGQRRLKRLEQQKLFKEEPAAQTETTNETISDEQLAESLDEEEMLQES